MNKLPVLGILFALLMSAPSFAFAGVSFPFVNVGTPRIERVSLPSLSPSISFSRRDTSLGANTDSGGNTTGATQGQNAAGSTSTGNPTNNAAGNNAGGNNGGATSGNGGNGGTGATGGTVRSGDTSSTAGVFNSMNNTILIIRLGR